ncbi:hypothetical protein SAMN05444008_11532 [Cnuella takakiae]|uniref:Uncharacterized protein n=1 Tax=Cnuella takakiae TaxID=1302690 RepID=A0A1M5FZ05_9BACT|nr:hypothetical protein SAMN05444008_11532 [Cnuella takakiae]
MKNWNSRDHRSVDRNLHNTDKRFRLAHRHPPSQRRSRTIVRGIMWRVKTDNETKRMIMNGELPF